MAVTKARPVGQRTKIRVTGLRGPDPWAEPIQNISASGNVSIDYGLGKHVRLTLTGNATLAVVNWPPDKVLGRLSLRIINTGNFTLVWPAGVKWFAGGAEHFVTQGAGKCDWVILSTDDGGTNILGMVAGAGADV